MTFAGINYLAILIAAFGWLAGAVYYGVLGEALGRGARQDHGGVQGAAGREQGHRARAGCRSSLAFLAELVMAWVLAGMVGHLGA